MELFKVFERKADHPMATVEEARNLLAELPEKPEPALEQLSRWVESLRDADGFACDDRLNVVKAVDEAARQHVRSVFADFFSKIHQRTRSQRASFDLLCSYWRHLSGAYARCVADFEHGERRAARILDELPLAVARSFRARARAVRARYLRYLEPEKNLWPELYRLLSFAEVRKFDDTVVVAYSRQVHTTPRGELLKILCLQLGAMHELPCEQVELAYRVLDRFVASFAWSRQPSAECNLLIDLSVDVPPRYLRPKDPYSASLRYFGGGPALAKMQEIEHLHEADLLAEVPRFGKEFSPSQIVTVIRHLCTYLGTTPPRRRHPRSATARSLSIVHGFRPICQRAATIEIGAGIKMADDLDVEAKKKAAMQLAAEEVESVPETWQEKNRSEWGVGVDVPPGSGQWAEPGVLCGIRSRDEDPWWTAIIRRLDADEGERLQCGLQVLSKKPLSVWMRVIGSEDHKASNWETSTGSFSYRYLRAILLPDAAKSHDHPLMLLEREGFVPGQLCELMMGEHSRTIQFVEFLEEGADFVRAAFAWYEGEKAGEAPAHRA